MIKNSILEEIKELIPRLEKLLLEVQQSSSFDVQLFDHVDTACDELISAEWYINETINT